MGTVVSFVIEPGELTETPARAALDRACRTLHEIDATLSTWKPESAISRLRRGELAPADAPPMVREVLRRCEAARELSGGWFDPWAMPGGVDPTGLVKGWAAERAADVLRDAGVVRALVNAAGDLVAVGEAAPGRAWQVGVRDPRRPDRLACVVPVRAALATSADYECPGQIHDPRERRPVARLLSATVAGPDLALADALATGLLAEGAAGLERFAGIEGYSAYAFDLAGVARVTPGFPPTHRADSHALLSKP
jgi:thiamine biosynthesis lipoprotein